MRVSTHFKLLAKSCGLLPSIRFFSFKLKDIKILIFLLLGCKGWAISSLLFEVLWQVLGDGKEGGKKIETNFFDRGKSMEGKIYHPIFKSFE